jgi:hypothetical protein
MRLIGLFEAGDFLVRELHVDGGYGVFEVLGLGGADYWRGSTLQFNPGYISILRTSTRSAERESTR